MHFFFFEWAKLIETDMSFPFDGTHVFPISKIENFSVSITNIEVDRQRERERVGVGVGVRERHFSCHDEYYERKNRHFAHHLNGKRDLYYVAKNST